VDDVDGLAADAAQHELADVDAPLLQRPVEQSVVGVGSSVGEGRSSEHAHDEESRALLRTVGVVVVAYASQATLADCLAALPVDELHGVVVVDNASPDDSAAVAEGVAGVRVVRLPTNRGFGAGCNAGAAALPDAQQLLFLNPDAVLAPTELRNKLDHLAGHPTCAVVAPRLFRDGEALPSAGRDAGVLTELRNVVPTALARFLPERRFPSSYAVTGPVRYVEGACFLVRADALAEAGGFDEAFFLFFEELDLARRLRRKGWTVSLLASARAEHLRAVSRRTLADGGRSHLLRSTVLYLHRRGPWRASVYVVAARLCWWLRARVGGLDPDRAKAMSAAVRSARA
jgi:GT2 family glycosyltransferase